MSWELAGLHIEHVTDVKMITTPIFPICRSLLFADVVCKEAIPLWAEPGARHAPTRKKFVVGSHNFIFQIVNTLLTAPSASLLVNSKKFRKRHHRRISCKLKDESIHAGAMPALVKCDQFFHKPAYPAKPYFRNRSRSRPRFASNS